MSDTEKKQTKTEAKVKVKEVSKKATEKVEPVETKAVEKKAETKTKPKTKSKKSTVTVTLKKSAIGRPKDQKQTLVGLGFKRLNQTVVLKDTPQTRGMIEKVSHLVSVE